MVLFVSAFLFRNEAGLGLFAQISPNVLFLRCLRITPYIISPVVYKPLLPSSACHISSILEHQNTPPAWLDNPCSS